MYAAQQFLLLPPSKFVDLRVDGKWKQPCTSIRRGSWFICTANFHPEAAPHPPTDSHELRRPDVTQLQAQQALSTGSHEVRMVKRSCWAKKTCHTYCFRICMTRPCHTRGSSLTAQSPEQRVCAGCAVLCWPVRCACSAAWVARVAALELPSYLTVPPHPACLVLRVVLTSSLAWSGIILLLEAQ